jgi:protein-tyrosine phosphatase
MVCLGNICRSPLAEGILKHKIKEHNLEWKVDSAGTSAYHAGNLPDDRSIAVGNLHGIDITDQRSRHFTIEDFEDFDKIFVMDASNYQNVLKLAKTDEQRDKVEMIMNLVNPNFNQQVPDPYWEKGGFENIYQMLDKACEQLIKNKSTNLS